MTKQTRNGRKWSCKTSCLACTFFSICKLLLDKKWKKLLPFAKVFSLANEVFFDFRESFLREIRPKNYYSRKFLWKISRLLDLAKVSAPKVCTINFSNMNPSALINLEMFFVCFSVIMMIWKRWTRLVEK